MTGRDTKRRLFLYGSAVVVALLAFAVPRAVRRFVPSPTGVLISRELEAAKRHEATKLLAEYLRYDTANPPGRTREATEFLGRWLDCEGIPWVTVGDDPDRPILVARLKGRRADGALMLLHHVDVYPPGDLSKWTRPPFAGEEGGTGADSSFLYGRGAIDMKDIGVAHLLSLAALRRDGIVPGNDIILVAEPGEETFTPEMGVGWLFRNRPDLVAGVTDVFTEGGVNECLGRNLGLFGIEILQKAVLGWTASARTQEALESFRSLLLAEDRRLPFRIVPEVREFFRFVGQVRGDAYGRLVMNPERILRGEPMVETLPDVYRGLVKDSIYVGTVEPSKEKGFALEFAWTLLPGSSVDRARRQTREMLAGKPVELRERFSAADAVATPRTGKAWQALTRALELDPSQAPVGIYVLDGAYSNSSWLRARGIRSYGLSPFNITIFDAERAHRPSERIHIPSLVDGVERMKRIVREFATTR